MKLEIDDDVVDGLVVASLQQSIKLLEIYIKELKRKKKREAYEREELADALVDLNGLKVAYAYYDRIIR